MYYGYVNDTAGNLDHFGLVCENESEDYVKAVVESTLTRLYGDRWEFECQYSFKDSWHQYVLALIQTEPMEVTKQQIAESQAAREAEQQAIEARNTAANQARLDSEGKITSKAAFRDQERYQSYVINNPDAYGKATVDYAERWALLMEAKITAGAKLEEIANDMSNEADTEGITGFMYGMAVQIIVDCDWIYAEQLRRWHNHSIQIGDEGDRANEEGGVISPAILVLGSKES